jgi:stage V sporulation protein R
VVIEWNIDPDELIRPETEAELQQYIYLESDKGSHLDLEVMWKDWRNVKQLLAQSLMNWGIPRILVVDGNYLNSSQLYLKHEFGGLPLDDAYCRKTLEHIHYLWARPVYLETRNSNDSGNVVYFIDQNGVRAQS